MELIPTPDNDAEQQPSTDNELRVPDWINKDNTNEKALQKRKRIYFSITKDQRGVLDTNEDLAYALIIDASRTKKVLVSPLARLLYNLNSGSTPDNILTLLNKKETYTPTYLKT